MAGGGTLRAFALDPMIEDAVRGAVRRRDGSSHLALEPALSRDIVQAVGRAIRVDPEHAVVGTAADGRRSAHVLDPKIFVHGHIST